VLIPCIQYLHGLFTLACIHPAPLNSWPTALHAGWMGRSISQLLALQVLITTTPQIFGASV
jgi:hypothetical protein